jgi:dephospho-CoA kinase
MRRSIYDKANPAYTTISYQQYDQWTYELSTQNALSADFVVLPPAMIEQYKEYLRFVYGFNVQMPMIIYLDYSREIRLRRIYERDTIISDEAVRRLQSDEEDFQDFKDYTIRVDSDFLYP